MGACLLRLTHGGNIVRGDDLEVLVFRVEEDGGINLEKVGAVGAFFCGADDCNMATFSIEVVSNKDALKFSRAGIGAVLG